MQDAGKEHMDKNSRGYLEKSFNSSRSTLIGVLLFTVINLVLLVAQSERYFLFSASVPYYLTVLGMVMDSWGGSGYMITALVISAVILVVYLVAWLLSKKRRGWLTAAAVLFTIDTVALVWFSIALLENPLVNIMDLVFHVLVLWQLFQGVRAGKKLREMPDDIPMTGARYSGTTPDLDQYI